VRAYLQNADVTADGALTVEAHSEQTIEAIVAAFSMAIAGAGTVGIAASGSGAVAQNLIGADVQASLDGVGIRAARVSLTATDARKSTRCRSGISSGVSPPPPALAVAIGGAPGDERSTMRLKPYRQLDRDDDGAAPSV
jgi:hypothetical protein